MINHARLAIIKLINFGYVMFTINDSLAAMTKGGGVIPGTMREPRVSQNLSPNFAGLAVLFFLARMFDALPRFFHKAVQGSRVFARVRNSRSTDLFVYIY